MILLPNFPRLFLVTGLLMNGWGWSSSADSRGALDVRIPTYDYNGRINWELEAEEVDMIDKGIYSATNPKMYLLENQKPVTIAKSKTGLFKIDKGEANGSADLFVEGEGFEAVGRPWAFKVDVDDVKSRLVFSEHGKIGFKESLVADLLPKDGGLPPNREMGSILNESEFKRKQPDLSKDFPTTAYGREIYLDDLGDGKKRFLLKDDVFIKMEDTESNSTTKKYSTINCDWAEILLDNESNTTSLGSFGRISQIHAVGNVQLKQPLRRSSADELKWTEDSAQVSLLGNARVFHEKWGEAQGEKIIISQKDGRAEVIGGNQGRSRLVLPALKNNPN